MNRFITVLEHINNKKNALSLAFLCLFRSNDAFVSEWRQAMRSVKTMFSRVDATDARGESARGLPAQLSGVGILWPRSIVGILVW